MNVIVRPLAVRASGAAVGLRAETMITTVITITTRARGGCG